MANKLLLSAIVKGIIASITIFVLSSLYRAVEWAFHPYYILSIGYYLLVICLVAFLTKNKSLREYFISASIFVLTSVCIELFLVIPTDNYIFHLIYGLDAEMWAGDGFMILTTSIATVISCIIGLLIALALSFLLKRRSNKKQRIV